MAECREEVDRETASLSQGTPKDSPGPGQIQSAATLADCLIPDTSPSPGPGAGTGGGRLVIVISPEVITGSLESCQEMRTGHQIDLGGTHSHHHARFLPFTCEAGTSVGVGF